MWRNILAVIGAVVAWMGLFLALALLLGLFWPAYAAHGRTWFEQRVFDFSPAMAVVNLVLWALAAMAAGWVAGRIARRTVAIWIAGGAMWIYAITVHVVLEWSLYPWWYNLGVVLPLLPAFWMGRNVGHHRP